jgi:hypothetical protein
VLQSLSKQIDEMEQQSQCHCRAGVNVPRRDGREIGAPMEAILG